jgi:apolipoprotein N-acyltransferase
LFPFGPGGGLTAGESPVVFDFRDWRIAPVICFEDTVAHVVRRTVAAASQAESGRQLDLLVNLTNDGWFHGSSELDQHLITAAFRAVECRVPLVRAVNTGVSAIIDGNGCIREPERFIDGDNQGRTSMVDPQTGSRHKQLNAALVGNVPLDPRTSLYVQFGDWFGMLCCASVSLVGLLAAVRRYSPSLTRAIGIA